MKSRVPAWLFPTMLSVLLAACATPQKGKAKDDEDHEAHHPKSSFTMPSAPGTRVTAMRSSTRE